MTEPPVAPYGAWPSPITAEMLADGGGRRCRRAAGSRTASCTGSRPARPRAGARSSCAATRARRPSTSRPQGFNARTTVHEYGGGAFTVAPRHRVLLERPTTSGSTGRIRAPEPVAITPETGGRRIATPTDGSRADGGRVDRRARASRPSGRGRRRRERARRGPDRRIGRAARDRGGPRLLLRPPDLARRRDGSPG